MKKLASIILLCAWFAAPVVITIDGFAAQGNQVLCPVRGGQINKNVFADYQGKRIYFCCPPCIGDFRRNPDKYIKKLEDMGVVLEEAPAVR